jgi:subtilisin family serine protease
VMPPHGKAQKAGRAWREIGRLPLAFAVAGMAIAAFADASAQSLNRGPNINISPRINTPPNINIGPRTTTVAPPRVNITTPTGPRINQPTGAGPVPINPRYVAPQVDVDAPPPRRRLLKKLVKKPPDGGSPPPRNLQGGSVGRGVARLPPPGERRLVPNEVLIEIAGNPSQQAIEALARRHRLNPLESQRLALLNTIWLRLQITGGRSLQGVARRLAAESIVRSVQANHSFKTSEQAEPAAQTVSTPGDPAQYIIAKLRLAQAHGLAKGEKVLIAVIDSGIDDTHPELKDVIVGRFDTLDRSEKPHSHGTAIAGAIAAQSRLMGVAPRSHILGIRAFGAASEGAESTTFKILKGLDWAVAQGARVINMSFAGPQDPAMLRMLAAAHAKGIVLIAAAGNAGPKSPPLFPAADSHVIAVTATDADDRLFPASNRGRHITLAAPGVDIFVPMPGGRYDFISGTSFAAAHVSGVVALILERKPDLAPEDVRRILIATAKDLGPKGRDDQFGAGLTDAFQAITILEPGKFRASGASTPR